MWRRSFIAFLGSLLAVGAPLSALAQVPPVPVIGYLSARSPEDTADLWAAFRGGLNSGGFIEGKNVMVEYRWARGQYDRLPALAADLTRRAPAIIVATGGEHAALAAQAATREIPIVFAPGSDPIKAGLKNRRTFPSSSQRGSSLWSI